jgi:isoprenylcysteine carboxyl methyltransferase (ICMT) family protein YpbQ
VGVFSEYGRRTSHRLIRVAVCRFFSTLFESFLKQESFDAAFLLALKGAFFFLILGGLTLLGWTVTLFIVLASFLFRSAVKYRRLKRPPGAGNYLYLAQNRS